MKDGSIHYAVEYVGASILTSNLRICIGLQEAQRHVTIVQVHILRICVCVIVSSDILLLCSSVRGDFVLRSLRNQNCNVTVYGDVSVSINDDVADLSDRCFINLSLPCSFILFKIASLSLTLHEVLG